MCIDFFEQNRFFYFWLRFKFESNRFVVKLFVFNVNARIVIASLISFKI